MGKLLFSVVAAITCAGPLDAHACCSYSVVLLSAGFFTVRHVQVWTCSVNVVPVTGKLHSPNLEHADAQEDMGSSNGWRCTR
jgi:hypothetical protein